MHPSHPGSSGGKSPETSFGHGFIESPMATRMERKDWNERTVWTKAQVPFPFAIERKDKQWDSEFPIDSQDRPRCSFVMRCEEKAVRIKRRAI
jgi:hypothetical protein